MANTFSQESKLSRFELAKMTVNPYKLGLEKECGFQGKSLCIRKPTHCERVLSGSKKNIESWDDISRCDMPSREVLQRMMVVLDDGNEFFGVTWGDSGCLQSKIVFRQR